VTPGWRAIWLEHVTLQAVGDDDEKFGMNTAKAGQVKHLLSLAGVTDPYHSIDATAIPDHLPAPKRTAVEAINALVELRGQIVHTGQVPGTLRKGHVKNWRAFVEHAANKIDESCRAQCKAMTV
jgi:hypothetical protein